MRFLAFVVMFCFLPPCLAAKSGELFDIVQKNKRIADTSIMIYRQALPEKDRAKLKDPKIKAKLQTNIKNKFIAKLEKEFTAQEIDYLYTLQTHQLLLKYDKFVRTFANPNGVAAVREALEKK